MSLIKFNNKKNKEKREDYDFCFVCYEKSISNEKKPLKLKTQEYYIKSCTCDGLIHKNCLDKWYTFTQKCPICKEQIFCKEDILNIRPLEIVETDNQLVNNERPTIIYLFFICE